MDSLKDTAVLTPDGVAFIVTTVDYERRECFISKEALDALAQKKGDEVGTMELFHAYEAKIRGVARRMVAAHVPGTPLQLQPHTFR